VRLVLNARPEWEVIGAAENGKEAIEKTQALHPDVVLLDISMPGKDGLEVIRELANTETIPKILVLTMHYSGQLLNNLKRLGVAGYVAKTSASRDLIRGIEDIFKGETFFPQEPLPNNNQRESGLTLREVDILREVARGKRSAEIATSFNISIRTVETHRASMMRKLNLRSSADLTRFAIQEHILDV